MSFPETGVRSHTQQSGSKSEHDLRCVFVAHTHPRNTLKALKHAASCARGLARRLWIVVVADGEEDSFEQMSQLRGAVVTARWFMFMVPGGSEFTVSIALSDREDWAGLLPSNSIVLVPKSKSFWPCKRKRFERRLRDLGHEVIHIRPSVL